MGGAVAICQWATTSTPKTHGLLGSWPPVNDAANHPCAASRMQAAYGDSSLTAREIAGSAAKGDARAAAAIERYATRLAKGLASVINVLDPDVIVLGGGLSNIDALYERVPQLWRDWVFSDRVDTRLVRARHGDSSGVRGAAWLWPG